MTNKMKLIFVVAAIVSGVFFMLSTPFVVDILDQVLSVVANALDLYEARTPSVLALLVISGLYLAFSQRRRS
jgi:hypothetical protein